MRIELVICDLDGTLVDSDRALRDAFVAMGVAPGDVTYGHVVVEECERLGIDPGEWAAAFDPSSVRPFPGVDETLGRLDRWAVCSNRLRGPGEHDLRRFGWDPEIALFADAFEGSKSPRPILEATRVDPANAIFVGDTAHDRDCALDVGVRFAIAGWNPRCTPLPGDIVLSTPGDLLAVVSQSD